MVGGTTLAEPGWSLKYTWSRTGDWGLEKARQGCHTSKGRSEAVGADIGGYLEGSGHR